MSENQAHKQVLTKFHCAAIKTLSATKERTLKEISKRWCAWQALQIKKGLIKYFCFHGVKRDKQKRKKEA